MCICMCVYLYVYTCKYIYIYVYTYMCVRARLCVYTYIHNNIIWVCLYWPFFLPSLPDLYNPGAKDIVDVAAPPVQMIVTPSIPPPAAATSSIDELIHQSQWNLQQQEQHLHTLRQVHIA